MQTSSPRNTHLRAALLSFVLLGAHVATGPSLYGQAGASQYWTGMVPPPAGNSSYTLANIQSGVWDGTTENWANAGTGTATSYYAFAEGTTRIAVFTPKSSGYTVSLAYDPTLRGLSLSGGNTDGKVTIQSDTAHTLTFNGTTPYVSVATGRELTIGANTALAGNFSMHALGGGVLRWSGAAAAFKDTITINAGTLLVDSDASSRFASQAKIKLAGGTLLYNGSSALTSTVELATGKIGGTGRIQSNVIVGAGITITPGMGVGAQQYDHLTLAGGGTYEWEFNSWMGNNAGVTSDLLSVETLSLTADSTTPFVISLRSIGTSGQAGVLSDFDPFTSRQWSLLIAGEALNPADLARFTLDTAAFSSLHALQGGAFSLGITDDALNLIFTPVPEASTSALLLFSIVCGGVCLKRRRGASHR